MDPRVKNVLRVAKDTFVVLDYALYDDEGELLQATDDPDDAGPAADPAPIAFVWGYGTLVPGLERGLIGMAPGETREIVVSPEEGYGPWDPTREGWFDRSEFPDDIEVDDDLAAADEEGTEIVLRVVEVCGDAVLVDANSRLAGETLRFDVIVREVRPATEEERARARAEAPRRSLPLLAPSAAPSAVLQVGRGDLSEERPLASGTPPAAKDVLPRPHAATPPAGHPPVRDAVGDDEQ